MHVMLIYPEPSAFGRYGQVIVDTELQTRVSYNRTDTVKSILRPIQVIAGPIH